MVLLAWVPLGVQLVMLWVVVRWAFWAEPAMRRWYDLVNEQMRRDMDAGYVLLPLWRAKQIPKAQELFWCFWKRPAALIKDETLLCAPYEEVLERAARDGAAFRVDW